MVLEDVLGARVGLFVAGNQKCGTTSLFRYLSGHPGLHPPRVKEIHHFDDETVDWASGCHDRLDRAFESPGGRESERLRFDCTPIYAFWPSALERMKAYNPRARLILLFRDPVERAYSQWRMEMRRGTEDLPFAAVIREGRARLPADDPTHGHWRDKSYVERGFYGAQLVRILSLFPRDQVLMLASSDLRRHHPAVLGRIASFLDLPPFPPLEAVEDHRAPAGTPVALADRRYLQSVFADDTDLFGRLSGLDVASWKA